MISDALQSFLTHLDGLSLQDVLPSARARRQPDATISVVSFNRRSKQKA